MIGSQKTIQYITQSKKLTAEQAFKDGLVDFVPQKRTSILS
jgi:3-hydroxyacyl-CoA dehydrogenase/enoyl-CoA hydratase/3-hydroxybutyryl-CoA epimerase